MQGRVGSIDWEGLPDTFRHLYLLCAAVFLQADVANSNSYTAVVA